MNLPLPNRETSNILTFLALSNEILHRRHCSTTSQYVEVLIIFISHFPENGSGLSNLNLIILVAPYEFSAVRCLLPFLLFFLLFFWSLSRGIQSLLLSPGTDSSSVDRLIKSTTPGKLNTQSIERFRRERVVLCLSSPIWWF